MSNSERAGAYHRFRRATRHPDGSVCTPSGQDWLADLDVDAFRYGPASKINVTAISRSSGTPMPTLNKAMNEIGPLTEPTMASLKAMVMTKYHVDEVTAQTSLFELVIPEDAVCPALSLAGAA